MTRIYQDELANTYLWLDGYLRWVPSAAAFQRLFGAPVPPPYHPEADPKNTYQYSLSPHLPYPTVSGGPNLHVVPFLSVFPPIATGTPLNDDVAAIRVTNPRFPNTYLYYLLDCGQGPPGPSKYRPIALQTIEELGIVVPQVDEEQVPVDLGEPVIDSRLTTNRLFIDEYQNTYLWLDGTLRWIPTADVLKALVGSEDPSRQGQPFRYAYPPLPFGRQLSAQTRLIRQKGTQALYLLDDLGAGLVKRLTSESADSTVFLALQFKNAQIQDLSSNDFALIPTGPNLDTSVDPYPGWGPLRPLDESRNYCDCSFAMAHDSHTAKYFENSESVGLRVDQNMPVLFQLIAGVRTLRISSGTYLLEGLTTVILQHGNPSGFGGPESYMGNLEDYLRDVKAFLDAHPTEIITIIDEGDASELPLPDSDFVKLVGHVYQNIFGRQMLFNHAGSSPPADNFPTLGDLRRSGQRVVVFMPTLSGIAATMGPPNPFPWMLPCYTGDSATLIGMTQWEGSVIEDPSDPPASLPDSYFISERWPASTNPPLYLVNHYYVHDGGAYTESYQPYAKWGVGDLVVSDSVRAWELHQRPNFINCDFFQGNVNDITLPAPGPFFQGVADAKSRVIDLVNALNRASSPDEVATYLAHTDSR